MHFLFRQLTAWHDKSMEFNRTATKDIFVVINTFIICVCEIYKLHYTCTNVSSNNPIRFFNLKFFVAMIMSI